MTSTVTNLEAQRNRLTEDLFRAIKGDRPNRLKIHALAAAIHRIDRQIAEARQSDTSSADPLGVGA